jgi:hypothetical protein
LNLAREAGSIELEAAALGGLADAEYMCGRFRSACERFTECVEFSQKHGLGRIEVANRPMVAVSALWSGQPQRAYAAALESIDAARRVGSRRAEMIATDAAFLCYKTRGDVGRARENAEQTLALARHLGARRFEAEALCGLAEIEILEGRHSEAQKTIRMSLEIIRETGVAFMGPAIMGVLMLVTDDEPERQAISAEAEELLSAGSLSHNHIAFRSNAIEACLRSGAYDEAERHACALADYCPEEPSPHARFVAGRGMVLARLGRGEMSGELAAEIDRLIAEGERMQHNLALADLRRAKDAMAA